MIRPGRMTLDDVVADIESRYRCVAGLPCASSQTGEEYTELVIGGPRPHELSQIGFASDMYAAAAAWWHEFNEFARGKSGTLYWRIAPDIADTLLFKDVTFIRDSKTPVYEPMPAFRVYARLLISEKPVIYADMAAYEASRAVAA